MNLTWHILKKDFVRLRLPLALWVILMWAVFWWVTGFSGWRPTTWMRFKSPSAP